MEVDCCSQLFASMSWPQIETGRLAPMTFNSDPRIESTDNSKDISLSCEIEPEKSRRRTRREDANTKQSRNRPDSITGSAASPRASNYGERQMP